jgi:hypothetical protein
MTTTTDQGQVKRRWRFRIEDENGDDVSLDEFFNPSFFVGTSSEADAEAERLANLWEQQTGGLALQVVSESHGVVS